MSKTVHIALDEDGLEGQWLDVRDPKFLSKRTIDRWQQGVEDGSLTPEAMLREFVAAWHIVDADNSEQELNTPATDSIEGVPLVVFQVLNQRVGQLFRGAVASNGSGPDAGSLAT